MKSKYIIISKNGNILDPQEFYNSGRCEAEMKVCIEREVLEINASKENIKPEYLKYANKLGFKWEDHSANGLIQYDYKANLISRLVQEYSRKLVLEIGMPIYEVKGSNIFDMKYPVVDAYAKLFGDRLFKIKAENSEFVMSYDASYPQFNLASKYNIQEKHLPFGHFSISDCYRYEQNGECMLLFRGRRFFMPDFHPYFKDLEQAWEWYFKLEQKLIESFNDANRNYVNIVKVSSVKNWEKYKSNIIQIAVNAGKDMLIEIKMDKQNRYWIIDVDYSIIDKLSQVREIGCIQIDVGNAKRLGIQYQNDSGAMLHPVIIHAAIPGGIERYLYMLFDQFKKNFPLWLAPIQVRLIPVSEKYIEFCEKLVQMHEHKPIRFDIDDRAESVGKRVKIAHEEFIPYPIVIGEREMQNGMESASLNEAINHIQSIAQGKPFLPLSWPKLLSQQIR